MARWGLVVCLTLEWLALGLWVGGLVVLIGAVIPAVFNTFGGQESGGLFLTRAFEHYQRFLMGAAAVLCAGAWYRWKAGDPAPPVGGGELTIVALMVVIAGVIIFVLHPEAAALQAQAFTAQGEAEKKEALESLFRVLLPVRVLYIASLVLGVALMAIKARRSLRT